MTNTTARTPGPWRVENLIDGRIGIRADNYGFIAWFNSPSGVNPDWDAAREPNAAFIVRAANSHDEMLAALEEIIKCDRIDVAHALAQFALAKARQP